VIGRSRFYTPSHGCTLRDRIDINIELMHDDRALRRRRRRGRTRKGTDLARRQPCLDS
jgi:hypothetical protein